MTKVLKTYKLNLKHQYVRSDAVVFSMDVNALYPSLNVGRTAAAVEEIILESEVEMKDNDAVELSRYVAVIACRDMITARNFEDVVMTRKQTLGRKPTVTGYEMKKVWEDEKSAWRSAVRSPTDYELK